MTKPSLAVIAGTTLAACSPSSTATYAPRGASAWDDGYRAVRVQALHGAVELASFGTVEVTPDGGAPMTTLHVRMTIANQRDGAPWTLAGQTIALEIPGERTAHPLFVNTDLATRPIALAGRGEQRVLDLYFPVPPAVADEDDLAAFDVDWCVLTPAGPVEQRTHFDRLREDEAPPAIAVAHPAGWGAYWWADPSYAWSTFHHEDGVITPAAPSAAAVTRAPLRQR